MSVNKYKPHLYVIPEDDADRQIADGFVLHPSVASRQVQVMEPAGGWSRVLETFKEEYLPLLQENLQTYVVLLIDFDGNPDERREHFKSQIPDAIRNRVFVIGPRERPEALRQAINKGYEAIGSSLAADCDNDRVEVWSHDHLQHNEVERLGLIQAVKPFLFN